MPSRFARNLDRTLQSELSDLFGLDEGPPTTDELGDHGAHATNIVSRLASLRLIA